MSSNKEFWRRYLAEWQRRKADLEAEALKASPFSYGRKPDVGPWDVWCQRFGIDPNTPDERILDDYLHGRVPGQAFGGWVPSSVGDKLRAKAKELRMQITLQWRDDHQRDAYATWDAYDLAYQRLTPLQQRAQVKAEVYELERWWRL